MKEENLTFFSSPFLYSGLVLFYQVNSKECDDFAFLYNDRLFKSRLFFPMEIGSLRD